MTGILSGRDKGNRAGGGGRHRGERGNANIIAIVVIALLLVVLLFGTKLGLPSDLLSLLFPQPAVKINMDAWKALTPPTGGFTVEMPGEPTLSTRSEMVNGQMLTRRQYSVLQEGRYQFHVSVLDVQELMQNQDIEPDAVLGAYVQGLVRTTKGKLVSNKQVRLEPLSGRDILVESDGMMSRSHMFVTNAYLYVIEARSTRNFVTSADADRFFASFKLTGTALAGAPAARGWTKFAPGGGRFSVHMPGSPVSEEQRFQTKGGDMVLYLFSLDRGAAIGRFSVQYADYAEQLLKEARSADEVLTKASTVDAFNIGGKVVQEKDLPLGRYPGRELQVENAELAMRIRLYLVDRRLYKVIAAWPKSRAFSDDDELFLSSFRLAP